jgi:protein TonB
MNTTRYSPAVGAALFVTLAACVHETGAAHWLSPQDEWQAPFADAIADQSTLFDSVDAYKYHAAQHIMRYNTAHTFSGKLPPMLPAVVVLRITVDESGRMTDVWVQRAPDDDDGASEIAVASMYRAGVLPRPFNLATGPDRSLSYSETFLFNADYRFQLHTLAPIQTED